MDGMAGRPLKELNNQTTLQAAKTPNMDKMAERGITGLMDSIAPGIIPGSDTAHLSILGYNPYEVYTGRGPFEAVGVGVDVIPGDIAFRCNFSTSDEDGIITDRRAGRIRDGTDEIIATLNTMKLEGYEDIEIIFKESTGHRAVLVLRGEGLSGKVSDADPKVEGNKPKIVKALDGSPEAEKTADILNKLVPKSYEMTKDHPVNLKRIEEGEVESINDKYEVNSACIAETGLIMGIGRFAGMDIIEMEGVTGGTDTNLENIRDTILDQVNNSEHDFFLINIDGADEAGHDGNAEEKVKFIEKVDQVVMSELLKLEDCYIFLTADHSTPISVKNHSGDPVPILINGPEVRVDDVKEYNEFAVAKGGMCRIRGADVMNIITDLMGYAHKFGA